MSINIPELKEMVLAGVHFGHKKERSHPKSKEFVFGIRNGINIIDLEKTQQLLKSALEFLQREVSQGKTVLFVGSKRQAKDMIKQAAQKCNMPYVVERWLGGTLTNFDTVKKGIQHLEEVEKKINDPESDLIKKEKTLLKKQYEKLTKSYEGIRDLKEIPDILFVFDVVAEHNAVAEAIKKGVPVVGVCDTDSNPELIDWCIPANDDAKASVEMILNLVVEAVEEGKSAKRGSADSGKGTKKISIDDKNKTVKENTEEKSEEQILNNK